MFLFMHVSAVEIQLNFIRTARGFKHRTLLLQGTQHNLLNKCHLFSFLSCKQSVRLVLVVTSCQTES